MPIPTPDSAGACEVLSKRAGTATLLHACTFLGAVRLVNLSPILTVNFFRTASGNEPVRKFLRDLTAEDRKLVGGDIKTAQFGWPIGMSLIRKLETDLRKVRNDINDGIVRGLFTVIGSQMVLLHAFVKKSQKTPATDLNTAKARGGIMNQHIGTNFDDFLAENGIREDAEAAALKRTGLSA